MNNLLQLYGWDHYCTQQANEHNEHEVGRIKSVNKTNYDLITSSGAVKGELTGQLLYASNEDDLPKTGDWVKIMPFDSQCIITEVLPRYSELSRKEVGRKSNKQLLASNIDKAFLIQGLDQDFNPRRLERVVTALKDADIEPIILLNKVDTREDASDQVEQIKSNLPDVTTVAISALKNIGLTTLNDMLQTQQTYILLGSSGAGKSTLLNALLGEERQKTNDISDAVGKGKHTTTNRELFTMPNGSIIIDTAGVREFGLALDDIDSLTLTFTDISELAKQCRYTDCTHMDEPECAVLEALENDQLDEALYNSYIKLRSEAEHYAASTQDKKRKGKDLSKLVRNMKRYNIKKRY
ncbi:ribosome small subunit-dependent GTPase A [Carboxylicivirga sp. M1479]|uniref:ribosome small subunit-dependent GTPase A n=1 Tax=Carboxylicivirga sp. M1479 TaxID=2594476 RepID=UPI001177DBDD|nr:ribosome small subunit-dependent GTPase A [Carboxylicivirga sp. M1479]TRX70405.1 ribosome small subunit-dependent GTPase A [Carboxylicivirga sp. M1479]